LGREVSRKTVREDKVNKLSIAEIMAPEEKEDMMGGWKKSIEFTT